MIVDVETVFYEIVDYFKANLNDKIDALNIEKNDPIINQINPNAYIVGSLNDTVVNYPQTVFSYIDDIQINSEGPRISERVTVEIDIISSDSGDFSEYKRVLRYQRILKEVAQDAWTNLSSLIGYDHPTIKILNPIDITIPGSSKYSKVIGIQIEYELFN